MIGIPASEADDGELMLYGHSFDPLQIDLSRVCSGGARAVGPASEPAECFGAGTGRAES